MNNSQGFGFSDGTEATGTAGIRRSARGRSKKRHRRVICRDRLNRTTKRRFGPPSLARYSPHPFPPFFPLFPFLAVVSCSAVFLFLSSIILPLPSAVSCVHHGFVFISFFSACLTLHIRYTRADRVPAAFTRRLSAPGISQHRVAPHSSGRLPNHTMLSNTTSERKTGTSGCEMIGS